MKDYFNTVPETEDNRGNYETKAQSQNRILLKLFRVHKSLSPSIAWVYFGDPNVPLTSIRRAISRLTDKGHLVKTATKVIGRYGRSERVWSLIENE